MVLLDVVHSVHARCRLVDSGRGERLFAAGRGVGFTQFLQALFGQRGIHAFRKSV
jgi:hypothetical protein